MIVVYTCIHNNYDDLLKYRYKKFNNCDALYYIFTDTRVIVPGWTVLPLFRPSKINKLSKLSRWYKTHPHLLFNNADVTIWIDGNQVPNGNAPLDHIPLGTFDHPHRNCIYDESQACLEYQKDTHENMNDQLERYKVEGYPTNHGLAETCCIIRQNTPENTVLNINWWKEIKNGSHRDQLSFNYVLWKLGMQYSVIPGSRVCSDFLESHAHLRVR